MCMCVCVSLQLLCVFWGLFVMYLRIAYACVGMYYPSQERRADAVMDHTDQHCGCHVLRSSFPSSNRLTEEVQSTTVAGDDVETVRGILSLQIFFLA